MYPADIRGSFSVCLRIVSVLFGRAFVASFADAICGNIKVCCCFIDCYALDVCLCATKSPQICQNVCF